MHIELADISLILVGTTSLTIGFVWNEFIKRSYEDLGSVFTKNKAISYFIYSILLSVIILSFAIILMYIFLEKDDVARKCEQQGYNGFSKKKKDKKDKKYKKFNPWK